MRLAILWIACAAGVAAQDDFRVEATAAGWFASIRGTVQAAGLPVDLQSDLALGDRATFLGQLVFKPGRRHRLLVEGSPYSFDGVNTVSRTIAFAGRTFDVQETVRSTASITYVFGGYQFDVVAQPRGHFGLQAGAAYVDAEGAISGVRTGLTGRREQKLGLPLAGAEFRVWPWRFVSVSGGMKGMAYGAFGHFVQGEVNAGVGARGFSVLGGYRVVDADIHENSGAPLQPGIAPRIRGPVVSVQFRY